MVRKESQKRELGEDSNGKWSFKLFCMKAQEELIIILLNRFICEQQQPHFVVTSSGIILQKIVIWGSKRGFYDCKFCIRATR